jgi:hypothetical protein
MPRDSDAEACKKRLKVQTRFWNIVGSAEHINIPKLKDALGKEFQTCDRRFIDAQVRLMQTEGRIRVQGSDKVWLKQPDYNH